MEKSSGKKKASSKEETEFFVSVSRAAVCQVNNIKIDTPTRAGNEEFLRAYFVFLCSYSQGEKTVNSFFFPLQERKLSRQIGRLQLLLPSTLSTRLVMIYCQFTFGASPYHIGNSLTFSSREVVNRFSGQLFKCDFFNIYSNFQRNKSCFFFSSRDQRLSYLSCGL